MQNSHTGLKWHGTICFYNLTHSTHMPILASFVHSTWYWTSEATCVLESPRLMESDSICVCNFRRRVRFCVVTTD